MAVPLDTRNDIRSTGADGVPRAEIARRLGVSRNTVAKYADMEDMSPAAPVLAARGRRALEGHEAWLAATLEDDLSAPRKQRHTARRLCDRLVAERGYGGSYSTVRRLARDWRLARSAGGGRGLPGAGVAGRHLPGRLRQLPRGRRGGAPRPEAARLHAAALQRQAVRGDEVAEGRVPVRRARRGVRPLGPRAAGGGARQRHRGRQDGPRGGGRVEAVLPVQGALPLREPLLQPLLGQREGLRRERGGVPAPQPPRPGPLVRLDGRA